MVTLTHKICCYWYIGTISGESDSTTLEVWIVALIVILPLLAFMFMLSIGVYCASKKRHISKDLEQLYASIANPSPQPQRSPSVRLVHFVPCNFTNDHNLCTSILLYSHIAYYMYSHTHNYFSTFAFCRHSTTTSQSASNLTASNVSRSVTTTSTQSQLVSATMYIHVQVHVYTCTCTCICTYVCTTQLCIRTFVVHSFSGLSLCHVVIKELI